VHGLLLQLCDRDKAGQAFPPFCAAVVTVRVDVCVPGPQFLLQFDQPENAETSQSVAQGLSWQGLVVDRTGQAFPPFCGAVIMVRVPVCVPGPQSLLQLDQE
jgi:hypothetical protein